MKTLIAQLVIILCMASHLWAQRQISCVPAPVRGNVVDPTGQPIEGAKVIVRNIPYCVDIGMKATRPESNDILGEATSDEQGNFEVKWSVQEVSAIENSEVLGELIVIAPHYAIGFRTISLWNFRTSK